VEHLVVSLQPRSAPKDGVRRLPDRREAPSAAALPLAPPSSEPAPTTESGAPATAPAHPGPALVPEPRATIRPVAEDTYSIHVKVDTAFKRELDELKKLLSHKVPNGDVAAVLREAIQCAIQKYGKRKGAVEPARKPKSPRPRAPKSGPAARDTIPAEVKRRVWERDQGCCAWVGPDGRRCGSTFMLEFDHIEPVALGGLSTFENVRLACRPHNGFHAEQTFGRAHMARFRREQEEPRTGGSTAARRSRRKSGSAAG
jgi:HNH endonuclease